jgi:hypothetical protein
MSEKVIVEFEVNDREKFLKQLQGLDEGEFLTTCSGFRADDALDKRVPLKVFADAMEVKLRKNDHKRGWRELPIEALMRLMLIEVEELKCAVEFLDVKEAQAESVDVSNYCMMIHDRLGMLDRDRPLKGQQT